MPAVDPRDPDLVAFWTERHLATLTTLRRDGTPHVVPVGVVYDADAGVARIITRRGSAKVKQIEATDDPAHVAVCQVDHGRWSTLEGTARVSHDPEEIAESCRRYAQRYRTPTPNPERVTILIDVTKALGSAKLAPRS